MSLIGLVFALSLSAQVGSDSPAPELPAQPNPVAPESAPANAPPANAANPDAKLRHVPFPLEGHAPPKKPPTSRHRRYRSTVADLRDPFAKPAHRRRSRPKNGRVSLTLPDLKDPFRGSKRVVPKNWNVARVPGDIRDPFAPRLRKNKLRRVKIPNCAAPRTTDDGVVIQRPGALETAKPKPKKQKSEARCATTVPQDLRDPFANRS